MQRSAPPLTLAQQEADASLAKLLLEAPTLDRQIDLCLDLTLKPAAQPDPELREAAARRLDVIDARNILAQVGPRMRSASSAERVALVRVLGSLFRRLGGIDPSANSLLVDQIRSNDLAVAGEAIQVAAELQLKEAYLPFREIASKPGSPLRTQAIDGIVRLGDPRALAYFTKFLDDEGAPRDAIYKGLSAMGRPAALLLKSKLLDPDPAERTRALDALMPMISVVDLSALYLYIDRYPPEGELKARLYDTIATLEAAMAAAQPH